MRGPLKPPDAMLSRSECTQPVPALCNLSPAILPRNHLAPSPAHTLCSCHSFVYAQHSHALACTSRADALLLTRVSLASSNVLPSLHTRRRQRMFRSGFPDRTWPSPLVTSALKRPAVTSSDDSAESRPIILLQALNLRTTNRKSPLAIRSPSTNRNTLKGERENVTYLHQLNPCLQVLRHLRRSSPTLHPALFPRRR